MDGSYEQFLQKKIKDEHIYAHLIQQQTSFYKEKYAKLLKEITAARRNQNQLKIKNKHLQEKLCESQLEIKRIRENKNISVKQISEKRVKQEKASQVNPKQIFKQYIDNTFPKYKGLLKKIFKVLFILQEPHRLEEPIAKIKFYEGIFNTFVRRILDWLFPKKKQSQKAVGIAQNLVVQWKKKQKQQKVDSKPSNENLFKEGNYIKKIQALQTESLIQKSTKSKLQGRILSYQRALQLKGVEIKHHLSKIINKQQEAEQSSKKIEQILSIFKSLSNQQLKKQLQEKEEVSVLENIPLVISDKMLLQSKRKAAPILKKNIFGYYQDPQFNNNFALPNTTKHSNNNKQTQTLSEDLCILTLHPVIMVTLIDGNIKPQRNRHSLQHYVKIRVNDERSVASSVKESLQPIWNQPFLLKDYDFPFISVQLMHKSKGLRDSSLGGGKFTANSSQEKIVNVRKQKEFMGRVRFSLSYPKGNIFQFKITSVLLQLPKDKHILKQNIKLNFPYNEIVSLDYILPQKVIYPQKSVIILQTQDGFMLTQLSEQERKQSVSLKEFIVKEGHKKVIVDLQDGWTVVIEGQVYLIICEDEQPQKIDESLLEGGKGKYFSIRAPPPILSVSYSNITLHSNIKFPLVFHLKVDINKLSITKQLYNRSVEQEIITPIVTPQGFLKHNQHLKNPSKIYKFFIQTLEGEAVYLKHESHVFQRVLQQIHLQISYKEDQAQQINYGRKAKMQKQQHKYKQFTIQSKDLILNHYKIFTKHFKRIGFVKFKLGYTVYDNELQLQSQNNNQQGHKIIEKIKEGTYFLELEITEAHLSTMSNGSKYSCKINDKETQFKDTNHPNWKQTVILTFQMIDKFEIQLQYQITEQGLFGKKIIYKGNVLITAQILKLGALIVSLDSQRKNCLHFSNINIPKELYRLNIEQIRGDIQEQADWIGKIDPYLIIYSKNNQLIKTQYLDNIGTHPIWKNIDKELLISHQQHKKDQEIFTCKLFDYDIIGKDDYLGTIQINTQLNTELAHNGKVQKLYGNIVKGNTTCGSLHIIGSFEIIIQQSFKLSQKIASKISKKDDIFKLSIYKIEILQLQQYSKDKGKVNIISKDMQVHSTDIIYQQSLLSNLTISEYLLNTQDVVLQIRRFHKSFFKEFEEILGKCTISLSKIGFFLNKMEIKNDADTIIGYCYYYVELQHKITYAAISNPTYCKTIQASSDINDKLHLVSIQSKPYIFYKQSFKFYQQDNLQLELKQLKTDVYGLFSKEKDHETMISSISMTINNIHETKLQEFSERIPLQKDRQFYKLKYIHWQPFKYQQNSQIELTFKLTQTKEQFSISKKLSNIYNQYISLKEQGIPIIFDRNNSPSSVSIRNKNSKINNIQNILLQPNQIINKMFVPNKGALYYQLCPYNIKTVLEIEIKYLFIRLTGTKYESNKDVQLRISNSLTVKSFTAKPIGLNNEFIFSNISLLIAQPPKIDHLFINIDIINSNQELLEVLQCGFKIDHNKQQYRFVINHQYVLHTLFSSTLIERQYDEIQPAQMPTKGMSFIQLNDILIDFYENEPKKCFIELSILNQQQKVILQSIDSHSFALKNMKSFFFIQENTHIQLAVIEEGILKNTLLSQIKLQLSETYLKKQAVTLVQQIRSRNVSVGKITLLYNNIESMDYVDIDMFSYLAKDTDLKLMAQLDQFGHRDKYQRVELSSRGNVARLQSEDSFIVLNDVREYQINVSEKESRKMLGQFKLCHELSVKQTNIKVIQPLRTNSSYLNGLIILDYSKKKYNKNIAINKQQKSQESSQLIELTFTNLLFKNKMKRINDEMMIKLSTPLRKNGMKAIVSEQSSFHFIINSREKCQVTLQIKDDIIGIANLSPPFYQNLPSVITFYESNIATGICLLNINYLLNATDTGLYRQIESIQVSKLIDTELFVKMNPYVQIWQGIDDEKINKFISQLGLGKQHIFWKMNLIVHNSMKLILKDKDLFYDDLIGYCSYTVPNLLNKQDNEIEINLTPYEESKQVSSAGLLKMRTSFIPQINLKNFLPILKPKQLIKSYVLRLAQISPQYEEILNKSSSIQISILFNHHKIALLTQNYNQPILPFLAQKHYQLLFHLDASPDLKEFVLNVALFNNKHEVLLQQSLNDKNIKQKDLLFPIFDIMSVREDFSAVDKIFLWFDDKITQNIQIILKSKNAMSQMVIVNQDKRLLVAQNHQKIRLQSYNSLYLIQQNRKIAQIMLKPNAQQLAVNQYILTGSIQSKNKRIGNYYALISEFYSQGEEYERKIYVGKSKKRWLHLTICQAMLTKDLQFFSKMDPYCKFAIINPQQQPQWNKTTVQDDIGLHPVWNQDYFILLPQRSNECVLKMMVIDSEVTTDRMIGQGQISIDKLLKIHGQQSQISLLDDRHEKSGNVIIRSQIISHFIIFLHVQKHYGSSKLYLCRNKLTKDWLQIAEGTQYPLTEDISLKIKCQQKVFEYKYNQLVALKERLIMLEQLQICLKYDIFD